MALAIAVFIAVLGVRILIGSFHTLTDRAVIAPDKLSSVVLGVPGVRNCREVRTRGGADAVYVAFDVDVLDPDDDVVPFMPEPGGLTLVEAASMLRRIVADRPLAGAGFTGVANTPGNAGPLARVARALGL